MSNFRKRWDRWLANRLAGIGVEPLRSLDHRILVGTHHKTGTAWLFRIFEKVSRVLGLECHNDYENAPGPTAQVILHNHSRFGELLLRSGFRGVHMIRDPRDRIVSGCFYHQKAREPWLHIKRDEFGGLTYQEKINSFGSAEDRLLFEMEHSGRVGIEEMAAWDYDDPRFMELKYEDLLQDHDLKLFHDMFTFVGFPGRVIPVALRIAYDGSLFSGKVRQSTHVRSGASSQWRSHFTARHAARFVELFPGALARLGYEADDSWAHRLQSDDDRSVREA